MRVPETLRKSVVFLGTIEDGDFKPRGTGFFTCSIVGGRVFQQIVTARHCVEGKDRIYLRINQIGGGTEIVETLANEWFFHPDESRFIDVAVMPSKAPPSTIDLVMLDLDKNSLTEKILSSEGIGVGDEIAVTGLFVSHSGTERNIPIVRIGNLAAMPEEPVSTKKGDIDAYLIESRSIGGLSGSPVFVLMAPLRVLDDGTVQASENRHWYFLGLMHGHYDVAAAAAEEVEDEGRRYSINAGIGIVVPSKLVLETINQDSLVSERQKIADRTNS